MKHAVGCSDVKMVLVEILKPDARKLHGQYIHRELSVAMRGHKRGIWRIVEMNEEEGHMQTYQTRDLLPERHSEGYLTRTNFRRSRGNPLVAKDVFGPEHKPAGK